MLNIKKSIHQAISRNIIVADETAECGILTNKFIDLLILVCDSKIKLPTIILGTNYKGLIPNRNDVMFLKTKEANELEKEFNNINGHYPLDKKHLCLCLNTDDINETFLLGAF